MILGTPDPIAFTLFGIDVRWYGICVACGMLAALGLAYFRAGRYGIEPDHTMDLTLVGILCGVVGARLYYVAFNWSDYAGSVARILNLRGGGLAIHGGLLFGILGGYLVCRFRKIRALDALDLYGPALAMAQAIGRWGNYFNSEAHGGPTDLPWAILVDGQLVHPTFLYESLWCFCLSLFLIWFSRRQRFAGQIFLLYVMLYSLERFLVEGLRTDSLMLGGLKMAQVFSAAAFVIALVLYLFLRRREKTRLAPYRR